MNSATRPQSRPFFDHALAHLEHAAATKPWQHAALAMSCAVHAIHLCVTSLCGATVFLAVVRLTYTRRLDHGDINTTILAGALATAAMWLSSLHGTLSRERTPQAHVHVHILRWSDTCFGIPLDEWVALRWHFKLRAALQHSALFRDLGPWLRTASRLLLTCSVSLLLDRRALSAPLTSRLTVLCEMAVAQLALADSRALTVVCSVSVSYAVGYNVPTVWADAAQSLLRVRHERQEWSRSSLDTHVNVSLNVLKEGGAEGPTLEYFTIGEMRFDDFFNHPVVHRLVRGAMEKVRHVHELAFLHSLCEADQEKVMLFVLNKLSTRFNHLSALHYGVAPSPEASRMRHQYWFGLTLESGPGVHVTKLRIILMRDAELRRVLPAWACSAHGCKPASDTAAGASRHGRHGHRGSHGEVGDTPSSVRLLHDLVAAEEAALRSLWEEPATRWLMATEARRTPAVSVLKERFGLPVVNPHEPSRPETAWRRWQTLMEMAILHREIACGGHGSGVLWAIALLVPTGHCMPAVRPPPPLATLAAAGPGEQMYAHLASLGHVPSFSGGADASSEAAWSERDLAGRTPTPSEGSGMGSGEADGAASTRRDAHAAQ